MGFGEDFSLTFWVKIIIIQYFKNIKIEKHLITFFIYTSADGGGCREGWEIRMNSPTSLVEFNAFQVANIVCFLWSWWKGTVGGLHNYLVAVLS